MAPKGGFAARDAAAQSLLLAEDRGRGTGRGAVGLLARAAMGSARVGMSPCRTR